MAIIKKNKIKWRMKEMEEMTRIKKRKKTEKFGAKKSACVTRTLNWVGPRLVLF